MTLGNLKEFTDLTATDLVVMGGEPGPSPTMHLPSFLPADFKAKHADLFLEDIKSTFEVYACVAKHGGSISILHIHQVVVAKSDSCDPLADACD